MKNLIFLFVFLISASLQAQVIDGLEKIPLKDGDTLWQATVDDIKDYINLDAGSGTVTSVALTMPTGVFDISGSPITTNGTFAVTFDNQSQNTVFAGPSGSSGAPTFRTLVAGDIPNLDAGKITTGTLPVGRGGTGATSLTSNALLLGGATIGVLALGSANQIVGINSGATANEYKTIQVGTGGTDFSIAHTANTITINLPVATATLPGKVSASAQAFGGRKTFIDGATAIGAGTSPSMEFVGAVRHNTQTLSSNTTLTTDYGHIECDCTSGNVTLTFPDASATSEGQTWTIVKVDNTSNPCILDLDGTDTFLGGGTTKSIYGQGTTITLQLGDSSNNTRIIY